MCFLVTQNQIKCKANDGFYDDEESYDDDDYDDYDDDEDFDDFGGILVAAQQFNNIDYNLFKKG